MEKVLQIPRHRKVEEEEEEEEEEEVLKIFGTKREEEGSWRKLHNI
jgi:hypothetical protein